MSDYVHRVHTVYIEMSKYFCIPVQFCIVQPAQFSTLLWIFHLTFSKYLACNSQNCGHSSFSYVYIVHPEIGCILMCTWASQSTVLVCSLCWSHNFLHWKRGKRGTNVSDVQWVDVGLIHTVLVLIYMCSPQVCIDPMSIQLCIYRALFMQVETQLLLVGQEQILPL